MQQKKVNVGTVGHIDHSKTLVVIGTGGKSFTYPYPTLVQVAQVRRCASVRRSAKLPNHARKSRPFTGYGQ